MEMPSEGLDLAGSFPVGEVVWVRKQGSEGSLAFKVASPVIKGLLVLELESNLEGGVASGS